MAVPPGVWGLEFAGCQAIYGFGRCRGTANTIFMQSILYTIFPCPRRAG